MFNLHGVLGFTPLHHIPEAQGYWPADYLLVGVLFLVVGYYTIKTWQLHSNIEAGGSIGRMSNYLLWGVAFIWLHTVFEFAVVHYDQPWTFAKQWSIAPMILGFALVFLGITKLLRSFEVIGGVEGA